MNEKTKNCIEKYEGSSNFCKDNIHTYTIKKFNSASDVVIEFDNDSEMQLHKSVYQLNQGIPYPWKASKNGNRNPLYFEDPYKKYMNSIIATNEGCFVKVIGYKDNKNITVQFTTPPYYTMVVTAQNLDKGQVHNPYLPNKFGGYNYGDYSTKKYDQIYNMWYNILMRVNDPEYYIKYHEYITDTKENCFIVPEWLNFSAFAEWYLSQVSKLNPNAGLYTVNKDLLYRFYKINTNGMKCYGPDTCVVIPLELSKKLQLAIKDINQAKGYELNQVNMDQSLKNLATKFYQMNAITEQVYNIIING